MTGSWARRALPPRGHPRVRRGDPAAGSSVPGCPWAIAAFTSGEIVPPGGQLTRSGVGDPRAGWGDLLEVLTACCPGEVSTASWNGPGVAQPLPLCLPGLARLSVCPCWPPGRVFRRFGSLGVYSYARGRETASTGFLWIFVPGLALGCTNVIAPSPARRGGDAQLSLFRNFRPVIFTNIRPL